MRMLGGLLVATAIMGSATAASAAEVANSRVFNGWHVNGWHVNGWHVNGWHVNGGVLNGFDIAAAFLSDATVAGHAVPGVIKDGNAVYGVHLEGSELVSTTFEGTLWTGFTRVDHRGAYFLGTTLGASAVNPSTGEVVPVMLKIETVDYRFEPGATFPNLIGNYHYGVTILSGTSPTSASTPLCGTLPDGRPGPAVALRGAWSYRSNDPNGGARVSDDASLVTFACVAPSPYAGALGKCADPNGINYPPWKTSLVERCDASGCTWVRTDLREVHQACTRMVRADYCGNGTPHTVDGQSIDVADLHLSPPRQTAAHPSWQFEAKWTAKGASTVACGRLQEGVTSCPKYAAPSTSPTVPNVFVPQVSPAVIGTQPLVCWSNAFPESTTFLTNSRPPPLTLPPRPRPFGF